MQTFLPCPSFIESFRCLDYRRLGKQRVEGKQILIALQPNSTSNWKNHPAVKMWRGYENALRLYVNDAIKEWITRGYFNTMSLYSITGEIVLPPWFGDDSFHASHRSNLLRKDFEYYSQFGWTEPTNLPYVWPVT